MMVSCFVASGSAGVTGRRGCAGTASQQLRGRTGRVAGSWLRPWAIRCRGSAGAHRLSSAARGAGVDVHAAAAALLDQLLVDQLLVALEDGQRIEPEVGGDAAHRGQGIALRAGCRRGSSRPRGRAAAGRSAGLSSHCVSHRALPPQGRPAPAAGGSVPARQAAGSARLRSPVPRRCRRVTVDCPSWPAGRYPLADHEQLPRRRPPSSDDHQTMGWRFGSVGVPELLVRDRIGRCLALSLWCCI